MAENPYAQYVKPADNPYAQFAAPQPEPKQTSSIFAAHPVPHTGFAGQVTQMAAQGPDKVVPKSWSELGRNWGDVATGAVEGVPAGIAGIPGDTEAAGRVLLSPLGVSRENGLFPTTSRAGDLMWGPARNEYQAGGRMLGNAAAPLVTSKLMQLGGEMLSGGGATPQAMQAGAAGYKLPPNMASEEPSTVSSLLSGAGGKIRLEQAASAKNQPITNALAAKELGLPVDEDLTLSALEGVRQKAGKAYEAVKKAPINVLSDGAFQRDLGQIGQMSQAARNEFGDLVTNPEVDKIVNVLSNKQTMTPEAAVELSKSLRYKAGVNLKNWTSPEKLELGHAQSQAANAVESLVERNLQAATTAMQPLGGQDMTKLMADLRQARQTIAKSYDIQNAFNPATGNVDARSLGALLDRGKPLTGGLKTAAEAANSFKQAMRPPEAFGGTQQHTALDFLAGVASHGKTLGLSLARPAARGLVLSDPYQKAILSGAQAAPQMAPLGFTDPRIGLLMSQTLARLSAEPQPAYAAP